MRRRALFAIVCALGVAAEVYALGFQHYGETAARGPHRTLLTEFGKGVPIVEEFPMDAEGLDGMDVHLWSSAPASLTLDATVSGIDGGTRTALRRIEIPIADLSGERVVPIAFAAIPSSGGQSFALDLRARDVRPGGAAVALVASFDRPLSRSLLTVDGRERWGSLVFDAHGAADTVFDLLRTYAWPRLPGLLRHPGALAACLVLYNALLAAFAAACWSARSTPAAFPVPSKGSRARPMAAAVVVVLLAAGSTWLAAAGRGTIDLVNQMYAAQFASTVGLRGGFDVVDVEIGVDTMRAIFAQTTSRIAWRLTLPANARFRASVAIHPDAWPAGGDGAVFRVSVERADRSTELLNRSVDPRRFAADRRWIPVDLDLSAFSGEPVTLVLETIASRADRPQDGSYDWALWGHPRIVAGVAAIVP